MKTCLFVKCAQLLLLLFITLFLVQPLKVHAQDNNALENMPDDVRAEILKLESSDPITRTYAAIRLREMKTQAIAAIPYLINILDDNTPLVVQSTGHKTSPGDEAMFALAYEMGKAAFDPLVSAATHKNPIVRERAIWALSTIVARAAIITKDKIITTHDVVALLISSLNDREPNVRLSAAIALSTIYDSRAVDPLIAILKDKSLSSLKIVPLSFVSKNNDYLNLRGAAARALGSIRDSRAADTLISTLKDNDPNVRRESAYALRMIRDQRSVIPLIEALKDNNAQVVLQAAESLVPCNI